VDFARTRTAAEGCNERLFGGGTEWRACPAQGIGAEIPQAAGRFDLCCHVVVRFYFLAQLHKTGGRGIEAESPVGLFLYAMSHVIVKISTIKSPYLC
jgi:hypothetical protein